MYYLILRNINKYSKILGLVLWKMVPIAIDVSLLFAVCHVVRIPKFTNFNDTDLVCRF